MREAFPFRIFIKDKYINEGIASKSEREDIIRASSVDDIIMDSTIKVPDVPGHAMIIQAKELQKREDALREILNNILRIEQQSKGSKVDEIELMTFIPEGLVGVTIGPSGKTITRIKNETGVSVVINQRVSGMKHRSTHATGTPKALSKACAIMYNTMEEQAYTVKGWKEIKNEPISKEDIKLTAKFIVDTDACGFIIGKHGNFTKYLENRLEIYMRCDKDDNNKVLKSY
jgi:transcription antitermination factor NusA-like protein